MSTEKKELLIPILLKINGFNMPIIIGDFLLRKITEKEKIELFGIKNVEYNEKGFIESFVQERGKDENISDLLPIDNKLNLLSAQYVLVPSDSKYEIETAVKQIRRLLLAFRLNKKGYIYAPLVFGSNKISIAVIEYDVERDEFMYEIPVEEIANINHILEKIPEVEEDSKNYLAIERYKESIRPTISKKISFILLVSILESLFLDSNNEVSFRFALNTSFVLRDKLKIEITFQKMKEVYQMRSDLVHDGKLKKKYNDNFDEIFISLKENVRKVLSLYLLNPAEFNNLENEIFSKLQI